MIGIPHNENMKLKLWSKPTKYSLNRAVQFRAARALGQTMQEIANREGLTHQRVSQLVNLATRQPEGSVAVSARAFGVMAQDNITHLEQLEGAYVYQFLMLPNCGRTTTRELIKLCVKHGVRIEGELT